MKYELVRTAEAYGMRAKVTSDRRVVVRAGQQVTRAEIERFLARHTRWIVNRLREARERTEYMEQYASGECILLHGRDVRVRYVENGESSHFDGETLTIAYREDRAKALDEWLLRYAREYIDRIYSRVAGAVVPLRIKRVKSYYGICRMRGSSRYICLNAELIHASDECIVHVINHELTHLLVPNHSERFYRELSRIEPNHRELEAELRRTVKIC